MINPLYAILVIPAVAVVVLAFIPSYRIGAVLNMLASGLTFMAGVSLLLVDRYRSDILIVDDFNIYLVIADDLRCLHHVDLQRELYRP